MGVSERERKSRQEPKDLRSNACSLADPMWRIISNKSTSSQHSWESEKDTLSWLPGQVQRFFNSIISNIDKKLSLLLKLKRMFASTKRADKREVSPSRQLIKSYNLCKTLHSRCWLDSLFFCVVLLACYIRKIKISIAWLTGGRLRNSFIIRVTEASKKKKK